ncbi:MAG: ABC transporter permease [Flexilinea sp.]
MDTTKRKTLKEFNLRRFFPFILLVFLCTIFTITNKRFFTFNNFMIVAQQMVVTLIAALGMTFVIVTGSVDLSVGSIVALSALTTAMAVPTFGLFAIIPAVLVGLLCGTINGVVFTKGKVPSFIVTMGAMVSYRGLVLLITHGAPVEIIDMKFINVYAGRTFFNLPNAVLFALLIFFIMYFVFRNFAFSREVRAVGGAERVARLTGINVDRVKILVYMLFGAMAGLAGMFQAARTYAATPTLGEGMELDVIAAVVVGGTPMSGGIGSIMGTLLGTFIICVLSNGMNIMGLSSEIQQIAKGVVLVLAVFATINRNKIGVIK